jgi:hypothetical protein
LASVAELAVGMERQRRIFGAGFTEEGPPSDVQKVAAEEWDELQIELVRSCAIFFRTVGGEDAYLIFLRALNGVSSKYGSSLVPDQALTSHVAFLHIVLIAATRKSA